MNPGEGQLMSDSNRMLATPYCEELAKEGEYWGGFIAKRLLEYNEIPGSVDFRLFFTQFSWKHNWGPPCLGPIAINFREEQINYILRRVRSQPGIRVLDLGCGSGWLSLELARQGAHVTGVDISRGNLALGKHAAQTNVRNFPYLYQNFAGLACELTEFGSVEYVYADLNEITLPIREYDLVVVWDSLHHVRDLERLLDQVRETLTPNGIFLGVDHAFATPLTLAFNQALVPWLKEVTAWIADSDLTQLYQIATQMARYFDASLLQAEKSVTPVPGFETFEQQFRQELLDILEESLGQDIVRQSQPGREVDNPASVSEDTSPFEDVSSERLMSQLTEQFSVNRFETICPLIMPEQYFPQPKTEQERILQHYLSSALIRICDKAVELEQADGQWFFFEVTNSSVPPEAPSRQIERIRNSRSADSIAHATDLRFAESLLRSDWLGGQLDIANRNLEEQRAYISHLETEMDRKNIALRDTAHYANRLEQELRQAREPRLPWKRTSHT